MGSSASWAAGRRGGGRPGPPCCTTRPVNAVNDPLARRRTITCSENTKTGAFFINGEEFDLQRVSEHVKLGTTEEWVIRNTADEQHPLHLHVNDFQVMSVNGRPHPARSPQDTVPLPVHGTVVVRMRFRDYLGKYVFHGHILAHEDAGMMAIVEVTKDGKAPQGGAGAGAAPHSDMTGRRGAIRPPPRPDRPRPRRRGAARSPRR